MTEFTSPPAHSLGPTRGADPEHSPDPTSLDLVSRKVSDSTVRRLSHYLRVLELRSSPGEETVSSRQLAEATGTTAAQVRKDLSIFGSFGKRGQGYDVPELTGRLRSIMGLERGWRVALLGVGRIGSALVEYGEFRARGFNIVAIFDTDAGKIGQRRGGIEILSTDSLPQVVREEAIQLAVIAVPTSAAQEMVDAAVAAGVRGILNFAPRKIRVPEGVAIQSVNMVMELEALAFKLSGNGEASGSEE